MEVELSAESATLDPVPHLRCSFSGCPYPGLAAGAIYLRSFGPNIRSVPEF
jgi:hypothetical protein